MIGGSLVTSLGLHLSLLLGLTCHFPNERICLMFQRIRLKSFSPGLASGLGPRLQLRLVSGSRGEKA